jgi:para-nitrobenzyl esterase
VKTMTMNRPRNELTAWVSTALLLLVVMSGMVHAAVVPTGLTSDNRVRVDGGWISGKVGPDSQFRVFKGIPYAAPPVGELRWKPPQAVVPWDGVRDAGVFGPSCSQTRLDPDNLIYDLVPDEKQPIGEDCLYLNIWTSARSPLERRPVLLWIHPSAFIFGGAAAPIYEGETLARKGAIVVTINYRLGIFGFLAHPQLSKESAHGSSGNYGLLDTIAAIKWARRNISMFGGDPDRIAIWGESAGSALVSALTASPLVKRDISGAIAEDGLQFNFARTGTLDHDSGVH